MSTKKLKKILFVGGGTGGHIYPALAVAQALKDSEDCPEIVFVGSRTGMEQTLVQLAGFRIRSIAIKGLQRGRILANLKLAVLIPLSIAASLAILHKEKPDLIFGTGGYVCGPILFSAMVMRKAIMLQGPDAYPGLILRLFAWYSKKVFLGFEAAQSFLAGKTVTVVTGNPIREAAFRTQQDIRAQYHIGNTDRVLFVFGGSQGSVPINNLVKESLGEILSSGNIHILWQTGKQDFENIKEAVKTYPQVHVQPYIRNMGDFYGAADLAVCRAGAMTIAELARSGLPGVLIPLPHAAADHQTVNAQMVEKAGGGVCLRQAAAKEELARTVCRLLHGSDELDRMSENIRTLHREDAAQTIAREILKELKE